MNDNDIYSLKKEEVDYDPSKTEVWSVRLVEINDKETIFGQTPWITDEVEDKI